jgi:two-component sensor histidine kinase/ligand-binding sensor domain-containing protein
MWFGTFSGLARYDGYNFVIYKNDPLDSTSLSNNWIWGLCEDRLGFLWIGTGGGGLNRFDRNGEIFKRYEYDENNPNSLGNNIVMHIHEDRSGDLWIGTEGSGLNKFDRDKEEFTRYVHKDNDPQSISNNIIREIYEDKKGIFWIATDGGGLNKFDPENEIFTHWMYNKNDPNSLNDNRTMEVYIDKSGILWVGTYSGGLNRFDRDREIFVNYKFDANNPHSLSGNHVRDVYEDQTGSIWICTYGGGLSRLDCNNKKKETFMSYKYDPNNPNSLGNDYIWVIYEDRSGVIWIGTEKGGINKFNRRKEVFNHWKNEPGISSSLNDNHIWAIYEDRAGIFWIGTRTGGLNRFDRKNGTFKHYKNEINNPNSLSGNYVISIYEDRSGILWIGTYYNGLNRFDRKKNCFIHYKHEEDKPNSLSHNRVRATFEDHFGKLWILTRQGLDKFDPVKEEFFHYKKLEGDLNSISNNNIRVIYEDRAGTLWIGTDGGLNKYVPKNNNKEDYFIRYQNEENNPNSLSYDKIRSIYEDKKGRFWIGTRGGLNRLDRENEQFYAYTEEDGLPSNVIYGILEDDSGFLWLSTTKGISKFDPETEVFRNYDSDDGLQDNEFELGAYCQSRNGEIFFGGINGFNSFYPDRVKDNPYVPPIVITCFKIFDHIIKFDKDVSMLNEIELSYRDNFFSFEFSALDYVSPRKNKYAYKLEGFDSDWNYCGSRRYTSYTNLNPGRYVFNVKGSNNHGIWNEEGLALEIKIRPPFWMTLWFRIIVFLGIILLIIAIIQYRTHNVKKRNVELEAINKMLNKQITVRKKTEKALRESEERLSVFMNSAPESFILFDAEMNIVDFNEASMKYYPVKVKKSDLIGKNLRDIEPNFEETDRYAMYMEVLKTGKSIFLDAVVSHSKFGDVYFAVRAFKVGDGLGLILEDVTERKSAEIAIKASLKEKEVMLKEIHHRVKNNLQIISSLLHLQAEHVGDLKTHEMFKESRNRVRSMALIHEKLYQSDNLAQINFSEYIRELATYLFRTYEADPNAVKLTVNVSDFYLGVNTAIPCSLVINELVSNSLKYAFPDGKKGEICIDIDKINKSANEKSDDNHAFILRVSDNGVGIPEDLDFRNTKSLGLQLVTLLVENQLQGEINLDRNDGTMFKIKFSE